jgi:hypothetical protein
MQAYAASKIVDSALSLLQFDVSSLPANAQISSATVKLTLKGGQAGAIVEIYPSYFVIESDITWSNPPSYYYENPLSTAAYPTSTGDTFMTWEIGAYI